MSKQTERPKKCGTCIYWFEDTEDGQSFGECKRHAPTICSLDAPNHQWPMLSIEDWCGDWE